MKKLILFLICLLSAHVVFSQITFEKIYDLTYKDGAYSVVQTNDSGYIMCGYRSITNRDLLIIRTNSHGDTLWTKVYGAPYEDEGYSIAPTNDDGFIIAGYKEKVMSGNRDVYLVRIDSLGDTLWTKTFGGLYNEDGRSVVQTTDSGFVITGQTSSIGLGSYDIYLVKTDENGDTLWTRSFGGVYDDIGYAVAQTSDGGYIISALKGMAGNKSKVYLIRTNTVGDTIWTKTYGGIDANVGYSVAQTTDGGFIVTGYTTYSGTACDVYLIKTDASGDTLWTKTIGGSVFDIGYSVAQTSDGGYIITGLTDSFGAGNQDVYLIRTNANGNQMWYRTFGFSGNDNGYTVKQTNDGGFIIVGATGDQFNDVTDVYLIKTDSNGIVATGINENIISELINIFPNPAHDKLTITSTSTHKQTLITIFNLQGQQMMSSQYQNKSTMQLDVSALSKGIYLVRIQTENGIVNKKLIIQ